MDVIGPDEPLDADLRCFHGTDDMPICIGCAIELAERHGREAMRLREQLAGAVAALERIADGYPGESRDVADVDEWYRAQADTALGDLKRG